MARTKMFVSYSHRDRHWLERLREHLDVLVRDGRVHLWSDTRIMVGEDWKKEIEIALKESRVAVLLVSPSFLASDYIWKKEMPHIIAHKKTQKMEVYPLIMRPCVWRLKGDLEGLQARPSEGRALSEGNEAQVDKDLANFVYELAALLPPQEQELAEQDQASQNQRAVHGQGRTTQIEGRPSNPTPIPSYKPY